MISAIRLCLRCGARIPADAPEGGCPGCLLESGLAAVGYEDKQTLVVTEIQHDTRNERVAALAGDFGDYELLEEIGRGGQGIVYLARQKSLNRSVALKVISLGQWASKAHLKRFRREAQAAASLDHPYIVPIYEVGERDGSCYFSMQFVEGGQLDEVLKRTPMSIRHGAELIAKLARTVQYAHQHGILHRDIKPGNILLDQQGEPHLTDFGLARLVEMESTVTRTMEVLGTPSYMAPEQAVGNNAQLTSATDVYGLGAVLYQLLTSHPPFTEPRPPRLLNSKVDRDMSTICLKCLEKDSQCRYPSALALAEDLEHWLKHEPIHAKRSGLFAHAGKWMRRNPAIAALIAALVALAGAVSWNIWKSELISRPATKGIAVLPFENLSPDPDNAYFAEGIQEEILTRLASIGELKTISRSSTRQYQSKPRNLVDIAKQLGVANILEGSVRKVASQVRVNVQLVNAQTDSHLWAESYDRKLTDLFSVESEIAKRIAESLQAKLTGREEQVLAVKPTNNPAAYDAYLRGLAFEARGNYAYSTSLDLAYKATDSYERAVQLDPNFALAWARLSRADALIYFNCEDATCVARRDAAKRALENAQRLDPNSPETLLALGHYQYLVLRDYGSAKTTLGRVSKTLPGSSEVPRVLGSIARREGYWDESVAYFEQALTLDPRNVELLMRAAWTYSMCRRFSTALNLYDRALDITPGDRGVMAAKASIYQAEGNLQEAARFLSEVNEQTPSGDSFLIKIAQLRLERNYDEAIRLLQARLAQPRFDSEGDNKAVLALMQRLGGDMAGVKVTAEQVRNTLEQRYRDQQGDPFLAATLSRALSRAYAVMGDKDSALKAAERAVMLLPRAKDRVSGPALEENLAFIQAIFGESSRPISTLAQLLQMPYNSWVYGPGTITPALLRLDPIWDSLRSDPAFQKLCQERQP